MPLPLAVGAHDRRDRAIGLDPDAGGLHPQHHVDALSGDFIRSQRGVLDDGGKADAPIDAARAQTLMLLA